MRARLLPCLLFITVSLTAQNLTEWYQGKPIQDVVFDGLKNVNRSELDGVTQPYIGKSFSDEVFWELQGRIYALEFFDRISPSAVPVDGGRGERRRDEQAEPEDEHHHGCEHESTARPVRGRAGQRRGRARHQQRQPAHHDEPHDQRGDPPGGPDPLAQLERRDGAHTVPGEPRTASPRVRGRRRR